MTTFLEFRRLKWKTYIDYQKAQQVYGHPPGPVKGLSRGSMGAECVLCVTRSLAYLHASTDIWCIDF
ncbi:7865_t:CDS:2 [Ambispora gerdemannii]|uniref:7865_t:CDS:1 n=1 Tax=Ambispora gerdemannii TaxID=144530 RepID=A0A9N8V6V0_9GLOM|nr:7865_t:CDS:2 [Ambispora gerdemannii]